MEQDMVAATPTTNNKTSNGNGWKAATAIASVVAICGIGFGVYSMMQKTQADDKISDLKIQMKNSDGTVTTIDSSKIETTDGNGTTVTITDTAKAVGGPYIEDGYFYVPEWGVKYKLSDDLVNYGYAVDQNNQGDSYGNYVVGLTALAKGDYIEKPQATYYNDIFSCSVVTVRALEESKKDWWGNNITPDVELNGRRFVIHDGWREDNCNNELKPTNKVAEQLKKILLNPEKI